MKHFLLLFLLVVAPSIHGFKRAFTIKEYRALLKEHYFEKEWERDATTKDALSQEQKLKRLKLHREMCQHFHEKHPDFGTTIGNATLQRPPSCANVVKFLKMFCREHEHCFGPLDAEEKIAAKAYEIGCRCNLEKMAQKLKTKMEGLKDKMATVDEGSSEEEEDASSGKENSVEIIKLSHDKSSSANDDDTDEERK